jgi:hypothetical protein
MASQPLEREIDRELRYYDAHEREQLSRDREQLEELLAKQQQMRFAGDYKEFLAVWRGSGTEVERREWSELVHQVRGERRASVEDAHDS